MKGLFITFEGTEGCGKSTQVGLLADRLRSMGCFVRTLREPDQTMAAAGDQAAHRGIRGARCVHIPPR